MNGNLTLTLGGSIELLLRPAPPEITPIVTVSYAGFSATAKGTHMAYTLQSGFQVHVQIAYVDANGNPAIVDGPVAWTASNSAVVAVSTSTDDDTMCTISAPGPIGSGQVTATADADLGSGVKQITTLLDVSVVAGEAVAGTVTVLGDPEPIA